MIKAGIVGGTGYTGVELLRLLVAHPEVELAAITSRSNVGQPVAESFPNLRQLKQTFQAPDFSVLSQCDVVFFATPNGTAMQHAPALLDKGVRVIDLAADFRLKDESEWEKWYGIPHACPELLGQAVYGLPEINRAKIAGAQLIANPGCYPTAVSLGLLPLLKADLIQTGNIIADTKSGVSGAGRKPDTAYLICEASENLKAYAVTGHRHIPEIHQLLGPVVDSELNITFIPHLIPMIRGMLATLYVELKGQEADLQNLYQDFYKEEYFVEVLGEGEIPQTRSVRGANSCQIGIARPYSQAGKNNQFVILSTIDNLVKGAAGQAVQNMNIVFELSENCGLTTVGVVP